MAVKKQSYSRRQLLGERLEDRSMLSITPLAGDYDGNNVVDGDDHAIWAATYGSTTDLRADGNGDGRIDAADYTVYRDNQGQMRTPAPFLNLVVDTLGETEESASGAIVFRNSDFSKEMLASQQPESGLPLFDPDYLAGPTVYDPNAADDFTTGSVRIDTSMLGGSYGLTFTFGDDVRLWTNTWWAGTVDAGGGKFQIPSGVSLIPTTVHLDFQIEGLTSSTAFATESIMVQAVPNAGATLTDTATYTVVDTGIGVDGNRDQAIDFCEQPRSPVAFLAQ